MVYTFSRVSNIETIYVHINLFPTEGTLANWTASAWDCVCQLAHSAATDCDI